MKSQHNSNWVSSDQTCQVQWRAAFLVLGVVVCSSGEEPLQDLDMAFLLSGGILGE